jgi:hypothetical protein
MLRFEFGDDRYSMGIRQKLAAEFGSEPDKKGLLGRQAADDVVVKARRSPEYKVELSKSRFCGVFPGDGWSGRMEDSILNGCIPVIVQVPSHCCCKKHQQFSFALLSENYI